MRKTIHKNENGQAMVEFAVCLPFLVLILAAIIDFGWIFSCKNELNNVAGEAARVAAIHANEASDKLKQDVTDYVTTREVTGSSTTVESVDVSSGVYAKVTVKTDVKYLTGIPGILTHKNTITLKAYGSMPINPYTK